MLEPSRGTLAFVVGALALSACVFPRDAPSGLELAWVAEESNPADGDEALRTRTCEGSLITRVEVELQDLDDEERGRRFGYACDDALLDEFDLSLRPSPVFVELNPGSYALKAWAIDDPSDREAEGEIRVLDELEAEIDIVDTVQIRAITWRPPTASFEVLIEGLDACTEDVALALNYADARVDLYDPPEIENDEEEEAPPLPYRSGLVSEAGLALDGEARACDALEPGVHRFEGIDRGVYSLTLAYGDVQCAWAVEVGTDATQAVVLDLSEAPC